MQITSAEKLVEEENEKNGWRVIIYVFCYQRFLVLVFNDDENIH